jgi:hypothetical protein
MHVISLTKLCICRKLLNSLKLKQKTNHENLLSRKSADILNKKDQ